MTGQRTADRSSACYAARRSERSSSKSTCRSSVAIDALHARAARHAGNADHSTVDVCSTTELAGPRTAESPPDLAKRRTRTAKSRDLPPLLLAQYSVGPPSCQARQAGRRAWQPYASSSSRRGRPRRCRGRPAALKRAAATRLLLALTEGERRRDPPAVLLRQQTGRRQDLFPLARGGAVGRRAFARARQRGSPAGLAPNSVPFLAKPRSCRAPGGVKHPLGRLVSGT